MLVLLTLIILSCTNDDAPISTNTAVTVCNNGFANGYPCNGIDLLSSISLQQFNADSANDSWGWKDPQTSKEYAIVGLDNGTAFVDVSTPTEPIYLGKLPTHTIASSWRDIKVYNNHAFIVSEAPNHGMQIFDLTRLRALTTTPEVFTADAHYNGFGSAHNIIINETTDYAYVVGTQTFSGGPHFVNIQNPTSPIASGGYATNGYSHDAQVVTYNGPDADYQNAEILIGSNENEVVIVNITDKNNPQEIATINYPQIGYTHQGWFTQDQRYFIAGDELDERNIGVASRTLVFDFLDLDNPTLSFEYLGPTNAIDHNGYVNGSTFYLSNYTAGIRLIDISNVENQQMNEIAFFDTYPADNNTAFSGVWNIYPFLPSQTLIVTDINSGLFLLKKQ